MNRDQRVEAVHRHRVRHIDVGQSLGDVEAQRQLVRDAQNIGEARVEFPSIFADARRAIIGCANFESGRKCFVHDELESALAKLLSWYEARRNAIDQGMLLKKLQGLFDSQDADRLPSGPLQAIAKEAFPEAASALDGDVRQAPFDHLQNDDPRVDLLIRKNRPGRDVTAVVVELADRVARPGEFLCTERTVFERCDHRRQILR